MAALLLAAVGVCLGRSIEKALWTVEDRRDRRKEEKLEKLEKDMSGSNMPGVGRRRNPEMSEKERREKREKRSSVFVVCFSSSSLVRLHRPLLFAAFDARHCAIDPAYPLHYALPLTHLIRNRIFLLVFHPALPLFFPFISDQPGYLPPLSPTTFTLDQARS